MQIFTLFFSFISLFLLVACGDTTTSTTAQYPTAVGTAISMTVDETNSSLQPAPATLKAINNKVATVIQTDVTSHNAQEATSFTSEINLCDIAGEEEVNRSGTLKKITKISKFKTCKNSQYLQDGNLKIIYDNLNSDGKFPKKVEILVLNDYIYNNIQLYKGTKILADITYNSNKEIQTISLSYSGEVFFEYGRYQLKEVNDTIRY